MAVTLSSMPQPRVKPRGCEGEPVWLEMLVYAGAGIITSTVSGVLVA
jgi:hypothetical protein